MTDLTAVLREERAAIEVRISSLGALEPPSLKNVINLMGTVLEALDTVDMSGFIKRELARNPSLEFGTQRERLRSSKQIQNYKKEAYIRHTVASWNSAIRIRAKRISMNSPLVMDLVITGAGSVSIASAAVYLFKTRRRSASGSRSSKPLGIPDELKLRRRSRRTKSCVKQGQRCASLSPDHAPPSCRYNPMPATWLARLQQASLPLGLRSYDRSCGYSCQRFY